MAALLVFVAVVAAYLQSLGGSFVWDDRLLILDAPLVERGGSLGDFLEAPFWGASALNAANTTYYRPLVTLSFALDNALHHGNPGGYHLTNLVLHAANAVLLHFLSRKHGARAATAALLAVAWALQPRLAEAAAWISGRTDVIATLFTFAALLVWGPGSARRVTAALFVGAGLLAKESAAAGALALAAGTWVGHAGLPPRSRAARTAVELAPLAVVLVAYAALRLTSVGLPDEVRALGPLGRLRTVFEAAGTYAAMLLDPFRPRAVIERVGGTSVGALVAGIAVLLGSLVALVRFRTRLGPGEAAGVGLALGALLPVLHIVPFPLPSITADRFLYLPTAGLALAIAPAVDRLVGVRRGRWAAALGAVAALAVATFGRVAVWSDEVEFWVVTYLETPKTNGAAATELSAVYHRAGLFEDALILAERAARYDDPRKGNAAYNAALCLVRLGRHDEARARLRSLLATDRKRRQVELELAVLEVRAGRFDAARSLLEPLARAGSEEARVISAKLGEVAAARHAYERLDPASPVETRALLAELAGDELAATRAWVETVERANVPRPIATQGLEFLVQRGDREALARAARAYEARFGAPDPTLAAVIAVRLAELDRLVSARKRIGLSGPERTRKFDVYAP